MSENKEGIDNLLQLLTQRSGGIEKLLENFFSFLARRTDFYRPPDKSIESSLDHCVNLVSYYCRNLGMKYSDLINKNAAAIKSSGSSPSGGLKAGLKKTTSLNTSDKEHFKESTRSDSRLFKSRISDAFERSESSSSIKIPSRSESPKSIKLSEDEFGKLEESKYTTSSSSSDKITDTYRKKLFKKDKTPKEYNLDEKKEKEITQKVKETETEEPKSDDESTPPLGNGGKTEWYEWTQTLSSLEVLVKLPEGTTSKDVKVQINTNSLSVQINNSVLFEGQLHDSVKSDECLWALVDNKVLQISLEKRNRMNWWSTVIKGHPEIDVKKIVPEDSKLSDLDPETRSTVEKMMFDQRQKAAGLPTSSQQSQYEALERFKKAHPELDFSKANINFS